jgi:hypothetical protein
VTILKTAALAAASVALCACGGGGGSAGSGGGGGSGTLTLSTQSLTFTAEPNGAAPAAQTVIGTVTGLSAGGTLYITIVGTGSAIASISPVTVSNNTGQATVSAPAPGANIGTSTGTITVTACLNDPTCKTGVLSGSPQTINVSYEVVGIQSSATSLAYTINDSATTGDTTHGITITDLPAQAWSASSDSNWLTVTPTGNYGDMLNATLSQVALNSMTDGTYSATVTVTPGTSGLPIAIPVTLTIQRTEIDYVSPYVAYAGVSGNVIIRGQQFSQVTISGLSFGSTPASAFTVVSPTEIDATYPATLTPGRYLVTLQSNFAGMQQLATLVVVSAPVFTATALAYPDSNSKQPVAIVYDAERAMVDVDTWYGNGSTGITQFAFSGGNWQTPVFKSINNDFGLALSADGAALIAGANFQIAQVDPTTLATLSTSAMTPWGGNLQYPTQFAVANDGTVVLFGDVIASGCGASLTEYDPRKGTFMTPAFTACRGFAGASADGSKVLIGNDGGGFGTNDIFSLDTSSGALTHDLYQFIDYSPVLDRTGSHIVLENSYVYDSSYTLLGNLPATTLAVVLSPAGDRAYTYDQAKTLRTFDLTAAPVGGMFPEIGTGITLAGDPGSSTPQMAITPDGATVFITGGTNLVVQPTP